MRNVIDGYLFLKLFWNSTILLILQYTRAKKQDREKHSTLTFWTRNLNVFLQTTFRLIILYSFASKRCYTGRVLNIESQPKLFYRKQIQKLKYFTLCLFYWVWKLQTLVKLLILTLQRKEFILSSGLLQKARRKKIDAFCKRFKDKISHKAVRCAKVYRL